MLILASLSGTFLGFGFVGLATKKFLKDPKLPAPEAVACDRMIKTAVGEIGQKPDTFAEPVSEEHYKSPLESEKVDDSETETVFHVKNARKPFKRGIDRIRKPQQRKII